MKSENEMVPFLMKFSARALGCGRVLPALVSVIFLVSCSSVRPVSRVPEKVVVRTEKPRTEKVEKVEKVEKPDKKDPFVEDYSARLGIRLSPDCNRALIKAVTEWLGAPYKYGGDNVSGTDCSGLVLNIFREAYGLLVQRSANGLYEQAKKIDRKELKEGDLVFFKINTTKVGHVGIYLAEGYFVHASTRKGVILSNLEEPYYSKYYYAAGRIDPR